MASGGANRQRRFVVSVILLSVAYEALFSMFFVGSTWFRGYRAAIASVVAPILSLLGTGATSEGTLLHVPGESIPVMRGCDGLEPIGLFALAVVAFPAPLRAKLAAALIGTCLLSLLNLFRVVSLVLLRVHWKSRFELFHMEIWPVVFVAITVSMWVFWAHRQRPLPA